MIGIQLVKGRATAALYEESGPKVIASASDLGELAVQITAHTGSACENAVITVPAYFNDTERQTVKEQAFLAGIKHPRLINEPTAAALTYMATTAQRPKTVLIMTLFDNRSFDVSLMTFEFDNPEILATNGVLDGEALVTDDPDKLFGILEAPIRSVLSDGGFPASELSVILLTGDTAPLRALIPQFEAMFGQRSVEMPSADTVFARGAAIFSHTTNYAQSSESTVPTATSPQTSNTGCFGIIAITSMISVFVMYLIDS